MKIVYISGVGLADCDFPLIREYQKRGHEVLILYVFAPQSMRGAVTDVKEQLPVDGVIKATEYDEFKKLSSYIDTDNFYLLHRTCHNGVSLKNFKVLRQAIRLIKEFNPDVVHLTNPPYTLEALLYRFRKKMVLTVHDPALHTGETSRTLEFCRKLAFKKIPKFILLNARQKEQFIKDYGVAPGKILCSRLGSYDLINYIVPDGNKEAVAGKNILFFGRISPYKGIEYLLEAMTEVHKAVPEATLTIAGGGKMYFDIEPYKYLDYIDIRNRYIPIEELGRLLENASMVVCPYTDSTQSGVVQTAFAKNKPVIATDTGGMREYISDGETGTLVPPRDPHSLAEAILNLLTSPGKLQEMEQNIASLANPGSATSWSEIAEQHLNFYQE